MSLLWVLGAWALLAGLTSVLLLAAAVHRYGTPPLLDGRPLLSALDEHAHERQTLAQRIAHTEEDRAPDLFAFALEEIRNLPTASGH